MPVDKTESPIPSADSSALPEMRELTDPKTMRALTHPVRLSLLEALALEGPLTATEAGELIGESPTTCSFHFRQLAKYGFVEEAGHGPGRKRHWKLVDVWMNFTDVNDDAETNIAAKGLERMVFDRAFARLHNFYDTRANFPKKWREASDSTQAVIYVTPDELREVNTQILSILQRYHPRLADQSLRPKDALPVELLAFAFPMRAPKVAP
ncbi:MAG: helix-turn-helix domain-containing protein [Acidimicrobiales bacterium]